MKFIIKKDCPLFDVLKAVHARCMETDNQVANLVIEAGADSVARSSNYIAGDMPAFYFPSGKAPEGWKKMGNEYCWWLPKVSDKRTKAFLAKMDAIKKINSDEISGPLGYATQAFADGGGLTWSRMPTINFFDDYILVEVNDKAKYTPVEGMTEILASEFLKLSERKDKEEVAP